MSIGRNLMMTASNSLHPYTIDYIDAMTVRPSANRIPIINRLVLDLLPVWSKLAWVSPYKQEYEQGSLLNMINPSESLVKTGTAPTFTADSGWSPNPTNPSYLVTPSTISNYPMFTRDNNHMGIIPITNNNTNGTDCGLLQASYYQLSLVAYTTATSYGFYGYNFGAASSFGNFKYNGLTSPNTALGHKLVSRTSSSDFSIYADGIKCTGGNTSTVYPATGTMPNVVMACLQTGSSAPKRAASAFHFGAGLNDSEALLVANALTDYNNAIGAL